MAKPSELKLGQHVVDHLTGLEGTIQAMSQRLDGSATYSIMPRGDGTEVKDTFAVDANSIEILKDNSKIVVSEPMKHDVQLGDEVQDIVTGLKGICASLTTFVNGCVYVTIHPPVKDGDGGKDRNGFSPVNLVKVTKKQKVKLATTATVTKTKTTGGPVTKQRQPYW